jgi:hypothetical protein
MYIHSNKNPNTVFNVNPGNQGSPIDASKKTIMLPKYEDKVVAT